MGRNSGGNTSGNSSKGSAIKIGETEKGYTKKMAKNILGMEKKYRNNKDETLHVFSPKGDIIASVGGKGAQVKFNAKNVPANSILTHNHPRSIGKKGINAIGNSFSRDDIISAVVTNAKEMRAVTPTYTFSVKRPKNGWGGTPEEIYKAYNAANQAMRKKNKNYLAKQGWSDVSVDRANATHFHDVMKVMAKKFGWDYSKKRG